MYCCHSRAGLAYICKRNVFKLRGPAFSCCSPPQLSKGRKHRVKGDLKAMDVLRSRFCEPEHLANQFLL